MSYVDGFVIAVPSANREAFVEHARLFDTMLIEEGALRVVECWGDDVPHGKHTDFHGAVKATKDETVCFSWVEWPDKATRDEAWGKIMEDESLRPQGEMPFVGKRMFWGGFDKIVDTAQQQATESEAPITA